MSISATAQIFNPAAPHRSERHGVSELNNATGPSIPTAHSFARPSLAHMVGARLRTWQTRARERAELAAMDVREQRDLPLARDFDIRKEIAKPFWRG